jgi:hypothetical protein
MERAQDLRQRFRAEFGRSTRTAGEFGQADFFTALGGVINAHAVLPYK